MLKSSVSMFKPFELISESAQLMWLLALGHLDDYGRISADAMDWSQHVCPGRYLPPRIRELMAELEAVPELLVRYEIEGFEYFYFPLWFAPDKTVKGKKNAIENPFRQPFGQHWVMKAKCPHPVTGQIEPNFAYAHFNQLFGQPDLYNQSAELFQTLAIIGEDSRYKSQPKVIKNIFSLGRLLVSLGKLAPASLGLDDCQFGGSLGKDEVSLGKTASGEDSERLKGNSLGKDEVSLGKTAYHIHPLTPSNDHHHGAGASEEINDDDDAKALALFAEEFRSRLGRIPKYRNFVWPPGSFERICRQIFDSAPTIDHRNERIDDFVSKNSPGGQWATKGGGNLAGDLDEFFGRTCQRWRDEALQMHLQGLHEVQIGGKAPELIIAKVDDEAQRVTYRQRTPEELAEFRKGLSPELLNAIENRRSGLRAASGG